MSEQPFTISTPDEFFEYVLFPNYLEFEEYQDLRRTMNLAISCVSMRDWMYEAFSRAAPNRVYCARSPGEYQERLLQAEPLFGDVRAVAIAAKHLLVSKGARSGFDASSVQIGFLQVGDPVGVPLRPVKVSCEEGRLETVNWMLGRTVAMWARELGRDLSALAVRRGGSHH